MSSRLIVGLLVVVILALIAGTAYLSFKNDNTSATQNPQIIRPTQAVSPTSPSESSSTSTVPTHLPSNIIPEPLGVIYRDSGFSKTRYEYRFNERVGIIFSNKSTKDVEIAADDSASSMQEEMNIGVLKPGESKIVYISEAGGYSFVNNKNKSEKAQLQLSTIQ